MYDPYSYTFLNIPVDEFLVFEFPYLRESLCTISLSNSRVEVNEGVLFIPGREFLVQFSHGRYVKVSLHHQCLQGTNYIAAPEIEHNRIIDLSVEGDRWEGDVWDNKPCGHGTEYDRYNNRVYEGFRIGDVNVCFGVKYYPDTDTVEYGGWLCEGKRWGNGTQYDRNEQEVYRGEWMDDAPFDRCALYMVVTPENEKTILLHNQIEELVVSDGCCNDENWDLVDFHLFCRLKKLTIGDNCFKYAKRVLIEAMPLLTSLKIGMNSFSRYGYEHQNTESSFVCKYNSNLEVIEIDRFSFSSFNQCDIVCVLSSALSFLALPKLVTLSIGTVGSPSYCFYHSNLSISGRFYHTPLQ